MTASFPRFSAVIFDLDGLVLDTESSYFKAWQQAAQSLNYTLTDQFCLSLSGMHYQAVEQKILEYCGKNFDLEKFARISGIHWRKAVSREGISVKKGFYELLSVIQKRHIPYCLATNSRKHYAQDCLGYAGLDTAFPLLVSRDCVANGKPSPEIFFKAAELLNIPIENCLILEDSAIGIAAANQTPACSILIPSSDSAATEHADFVFTDLLALTEIIKLTIDDHV